MNESIIWKVMNDEDVGFERRAYWTMFPIAKAADYTEAKLVVQVADMIMRFGVESINKSCGQYIPLAQRYLRRAEEGENCGGESS